VRPTRKRLLWLVGGLLVCVVATALLYQLGMSRLEGKPRTFFEGLEWAAESLSTTGYGYDSHWRHPAMVVFVVLVQFAGVFLVFLIVPIFLIPYLEERFEQRLPRQADPKLEGHVVVYRFGPAVETLLQRLRERGVPSLVAETDEESARAVLESGQAVLFTRSDEEILDVCRIETARAIVANGRDEENAALILRARHNGFKGGIYAFVENPAHRKPIELAGATAAFTPRHIVAAALAAHASEIISPRLPGLDQLEGIARREVRVPPGSAVAGKTLAEAEIGKRTGAVVVGQWSRSRLQTRCTAEMRIEPGAILELAGPPQSIEQAAALIGGPLLRQSGAFLVAGFGEVGRKVHQLLTDAGEEVRVVERNRAANVDVVGNVLDPSILEQAGIASARAVVLALDSDDATLFATVIARDTVPNVPVIARVNHSRNLENMHRAGADYALSISDISGEMLSSRLLGRAARARDEHRRVTRLEGEPWAGRTVAQLPLRERGTSLLAIDRQGTISREIHSDLTIEATDGLWVCGT
jgi:Trk K+ transport system NAD-binding subunit